MTVRDDVRPTSLAPPMTCGRDDAPEMRLAPQ